MPNNVYFLMLGGIFTSVVVPLFVQASRLNAATLSGRIFASNSPDLPVPRDLIVECGKEQQDVKDRLIAGLLGIAEQFAGRGGDDADALVLDEHQDAGSGVGLVRGLRAVTMRPDSLVR